MTHRALAAVVICMLAASAPLTAADASVPGEVSLEEPTLICLGVRWLFTGDDNHNAKVTFEYRKRGAADWKRGLDLFRVETQYTKNLDLPDGTGLFAGSVFDLDEDTEYELRLTFADPDGGKKAETLTARTRKMPAAAANARMRCVVPGAGGGSGTPADPFRGIAAADAAAQPGDVMVLAKGVYQGLASFRKSGTEDRPIVWSSFRTGEAIIDGGGAARAIEAPGLEHVIFDGLAIRNATWGFVAHQASHLTLKRCTFTGIESGFTSTNMPSKGHIIVDCTFEGPSTWPRTRGIEDTEAVQFIGDGHVAAYNRISGFGDALSIFRNPSHAVDFYSNEISECTDDGIEMDYGGQNTRCFRNRLTNCFQALSVQPLYGGPCYLFRNVIYNAGLEVLKMHNGPSGFLMFHNTTVKTGMPVILYTGERVSNSVFRNNLFVGAGGNYAMESTAKMMDCDWDYDGYAGGPWNNFAKWNRKVCKTLADFSAASGCEKHGVVLQTKGLFASGVMAPDKVETKFATTVNDLRLKALCGAIDAGEALPNINDGYAGNAPDLGAYEIGQPLPQYGPRPEKN